MNTKRPAAVPLRESGPLPPVAIVAVHGIGDQVCHATIQQVMSQFGRYYEEQEPVALGGFDAGTLVRQFRGREFHFSEVYWAGIPRRVVADGYQLEETKRWATTIAGRLQWLATRRGGERGEPGVKYDLVRQVIGEMVETIGVLERLTFLAERAGIGQFDLNDVLVNYLDDVQLVAEFKSHRGSILSCFRETLGKVDPGAEIYIVAHSEGTVVSFLGLLEAMWAEEPPRWLKRVRGFMTIGSPIDKHLVLWPELFPWMPSGPGAGKLNEGPGVWPVRLEPRIKWRNYYDYGDPVGFELDYARKWLRAQGVTGFEFLGKEEQEADPGHDIGFARYSLPGKAHNDYWADPAVFDHFIGSVIENSTGVERPGNRFWPRPIAYLLPYALVFLLIAAGVYFVVRNVTAFVEESNRVVNAALELPEAVLITSGSLSSGYGSLRDALGIAFLIFGVTVLARLPRLVSPHLSTKWPWIAAIVFALSAGAFWGLTSDATVLAMNKIPELLLQLLAWNPAHPEFWLRLCVVVFAALIAVGSAWGGRKFLESAHGGVACGSKPLIVLGGGTAVGVILALLTQGGSGEASLWPVILALAGFLYLWWLAILLFDLVFVWHRYIRHGVGGQRLEETCGEQA